MKRPRIITVVICLLLLLGVAAVIHTPRCVPFSQCSDLYKKYAKADGIDATFIKDFSINDTLNLDVTVLKATDSNGWKMLLSDFNIPNLPPIFKQRIDNGEDVIITKFIVDSSNIQCPTIEKKTTAMIAQSFLHNTFTIFHITEEPQTIAVMQYNYPSLKIDQQPKIQ